MQMYNEEGSSSEICEKMTHAVDCDYFTNTACVVGSVMPLSSHWIFPATFSRFILFLEEKEKYI